MTDDTAALAAYMEEAMNPMPRIANTLLIVVPLPHKALSPNSRVHWRKLALEKKFAKTRGHAAANLAIIDSFEDRYTKMHGPLWKSASIKATFYLKDKRGMKSDQDNRIASLESVLDGIASAGVVENDRGFVWASPPIELRIDASCPRLEVEVAQL